MYIWLSCRIVSRLNLWRLHNVHMITTTTTSRTTTTSTTATTPYYTTRPHATPIDNLYILHAVNRHASKYARTQTINMQEETILIQEHTTDDQQDNNNSNPKTHRSFTTLCFDVRQCDHDKRTLAAVGPRIADSICRVVQTLFVAEYTILYGVIIQLFDHPLLLKVCRNDESTKKSLPNRIATQ